MEDTITVNHHGFFDSKSFTHHVENCRGGGSTFAFILCGRIEAPMVQSIPDSGQSNDFV
jgi:hypothetical protein